MLAWLKNRWRTWTAFRRDSAALGAEELARLAAEVAELARLAARVCPRERAFHRRLATIEEEMAALARMTASPRFRLVSTPRLRTLRASLLRSRDQLAVSVSEAPPPTRLPQ